MRKEEIIKTLEVIKKSGELVFEYYKARGFKNTLIEVGIQNIIGTCETALEQIAKEKGEGEGEPMRHHQMNQNTKLHRCDRCGRERLPSIINSQNVDYCLECWNTVNKTKADEAEQGFYLPSLKREDKYCIGLNS
jgi:hypothetical protein